MLMVFPSSSDFRALKKILDDFMEAFGTSINHLKSHIFFFNTPLLVQFHITCILGFSRSSLPSKYLGVPILTSSVHNNSWEDLLSWLRKMLSSWTLHPLNIASRLVLLNSILQVIPLYLFSSLTAPKIIFKAIRGLQRKFLWQGTQASKKCALVA